MRFVDAEKFCLAQSSTIQNVKRPLRKGIQCSASILEVFGILSGETWWTNYRRFNLSHFVDGNGQPILLNFGQKNFIHGSDSPQNDFLPAVGMTRDQLF